jgi:thiol-disulfide isomerase/thioredoxin
MNCRTLFALIGIVLLVAGCTDNPPPVCEPSLATLVAPGLAETLENHRGQVVLVDFWATWCKPCLDLFPHTVELQRRLGDRGLVVITICLDDPDNRETVEKFLNQNGTTTENYFSPYGVGPVAFTAFGIEDGALPYVRIYDRQGKLHKTFQSGGKMINPKEIERAAEDLLAGQVPTAQH